MKERTIQMKEETERIRISEQTKTRLARSNSGDASSTTPYKKRKQQASIFETINNDKNKVFRGMCNTTALVVSDSQDKTDTTVSLACKRIAQAANGGSDVLVRVRMGCQATGQVPLVYTTATDQSLWDLIARLRCVLQGGTGDGGDSPVLLALKTVKSVMRANGSCLATHYKTSTENSKPPFPTYKRVPPKLILEREKRLLLHT